MVFSNLLLKKNKKQAVLEKGSTSKQQKFSKYFHSEKINVSMIKEKFKHHLIQLVVENGMSLKLFPSPAFIGLYGEMAEKLGVSLSSIKNLKIYKKKLRVNDLKLKFISVVMLLLV